MLYYLIDAWRGEEAAQSIAAAGGFRGSETENGEEEGTLIDGNQPEGPIPPFDTFEKVLTFYAGGSPY